MARGRKAEPVTLKVLKGTAREGRIRKDHPDAMPGAMLPPAWLRKDALAHFETIRGLMSEIGLESPTYAVIVAEAAQRMAEIIECEVFLNEPIGPEGQPRGTSYHTKTAKDGDMWRAYPQVAQRSEAARHLHGLLSELGLTPAAIGKVGGKKREEKTDSPFGQFGGKHG